MRRSYPRLATALLILAVGVSPAVARADEPAAVVETFQAVLLETMKNARALGVKGRYDKLAPAIKQAFHLPLMAATASAPFWRAGTDAQRERLLEAFHRMSASTVATLFDDYGGETFRVVRVRKPGGPTVLVDTQILRPTDDPIDITYVAARLGGRWWMIDIVVAGGISEVRVRRNEYAALLRRGGLDGLAEALEARAEHLLAGKAATVSAR